LRNFGAKAAFCDNATMGIQLSEACRRHGVEKSVDNGLNAICLLPVSLCGSGDNFDPEFSHVIPALIRKRVDAVQGGAEKSSAGETDRRRGSFSTSRIAPKPSSPPRGITTSPSRPTWAAAARSRFAISGTGRVQ
jgi:hypothetical protein